MATEVRNLAQFKRAIGDGKRFQITKHFVHEYCEGQIRKPTKVQTNAFYSVVDGEPDSNVSKANGGLGYYMPFGKASNWEFTGETIMAKGMKGTPIMQIKFID